MNYHFRFCIVILHFEIYILHLYLFTTSEAEINKVTL